MKSLAKLANAIRKVAVFVTVIAIVTATLGGCSTPTFKTPSFKTPFTKKKAPEEKTTTVIAPVNMQVTPRELLTARLVNPPADENSPPITVGKLIEFADRYLSCDCSGTRFVKTWERLESGYRLTTNSDFVRPIYFVCREAESNTQCYLAEIDRGPQVAELTERFVPGAEFIQFMYENGRQCNREEPCAAEPTP